MSLTLIIFFCGRLLFVIDRVINCIINYNILKALSNLYLHDMIYDTNLLSILRIT
jgi:hypothetical protein